MDDIEAGAKKSVNRHDHTLIYSGCIFVIAGWGTAEINYRSEHKKSKKLNRNVLLLKQKAEKLESVVEHSTAQYNELNQAYDYAKQRGDKQSVIEAENARFKEENIRYHEAIAWIEKKLGSREYSNNALARVIKTHLDQAFPSAKMQEQQQTDESKEVFQRIKKTMGE